MIKSRTKQTSHDKFTDMIQNYKASESGQQMYLTCILVTIVFFIKYVRQYINNNDYRQRGRDHGSPAPNAPKSHIQ